MSIRDDLPEHVVRLIGSASTSQFATMTAAGEPINTPLVYFPTEDLSSIDYATGLAYPAKAERARRNPKVGLLIEGVLPGEPVVSISGLVATRDADLQANLIRYISETALFGDRDVQKLPWSFRRKAIWYWARILMTVVPKQILWWDSPDALDEQPQKWDAPAGTVYPPSDPAPPGQGSAPAKWERLPWQQLAADAVGRGSPGHLSTVDADGFPCSAPVRSIRVVDDGFTLELPLGVPGAREGAACLTFYGRETFIGKIVPEGERITRLKVERALPILPLLGDPIEVFDPKPKTYEILMSRLQEEVSRRGQAMPAVPEVQPQPTPGSRRRAERDAKLGEVSTYTQLLIEKSARG